MRAKRERRKIIFIVAAITFLAVLLGLFLNNDSVQEKIGEIKPITGKYQDIYYKQTNYKNEVFQTVFDDPNEVNEELTDVRIALMKSECPPDSSLWDGSIPPNEVVEITLNQNDYKYLIDGYPTFIADITVTTVIIPTTDNGFAYAYTYIEPLNRSKGVKALTKKSANDLNSGLEKEPISVSGVKMDLRGDALRDYLNKYHFTKL